MGEGSCQLEVKFVRQEKILFIFYILLFNFVREKFGLGMGGIIILLGQLSYVYFLLYYLYQVLKVVLKVNGIFYLFYFLLWLY